jgi:replication fork clamp-binding protein CrfC
MINNILKKIEKANEVQKVELEKHEVDLALIDDFNKLTNSFFTSSQKFETSIQKIESSIKEMRAQYVEHVKTLSTVDNEYQKIRRSALDLGVEVPVDIVNNYKKVLAIAKNEVGTKKKFDNF